MACATRDIPGSSCLSAELMPVYTYVHTKICDCVYRTVVRGGIERPSLFIIDVVVFHVFVLTSGLFKPLHSRTWDSRAFLLLINDPTSEVFFNAAQRTRVGQRKGEGERWASRRGLRSERTREG